MTIITRALTLSLTLLLSQDVTVPVDREAKHHLVLENEWVRVFDVTVPPGDSTRYHVHARDYAYVTLGAADVLAQPLGGAASQLRLADGEVRFTKATITHRVVNPAASPRFHNLTIEIVKTPSEVRGASATASPAAVASSGRTVVLENERIRVERSVIEPGDSAPMHTHQRPGLVVIVHPATLEARVPGRPAERVTYRAGQWAWNDAARTHALVNVGTTRFEAVEIEWK